KRLQPEHRRDHHRALQALARLRHVTGQDRTERQAGDRQTRAKAEARVHRSVSDRDQVIRPQLRDGGVEPVCVTVARIARDKDVPAASKEILAEVIELTRAVGEPVEQYQRALSRLPMRVQARVAIGIHVGPVKSLEASGDLDRLYVRHPPCKDCMQWTLPSARSRPQFGISAATSLARWWRRPRKSSIASTSSATTSCARWASSACSGFPSASSTAAPAPTSYPCAWRSRRSRERTPASASRSRQRSVSVPRRSTTSAPRSRSRPGFRICS